ncbi:MAG: hypothetical protein K6E10_06095 [Eubacterium sp.]|nr:hypothetical protein [Eubacterium sp.]
MIKKILFELLLFIIIFIGAALSFNYIQNRNHGTRAVEGFNPTMGCAYIWYDGEIINSMQGYKQSLYTGLYRDSIVSVGADKKINIMLPESVDTGGELTYELRSFSGDNLIEDGDFRFEETEGSMTRYSAVLRMDMTEGTEYSFIIRVKRSDETVRYYTRVVRLSDSKLADFVRYAKGFSDSAYAGNAAANAYATNTDAITTYNISGQAVDSMKEESEEVDDKPVATTTDAMEGVRVPDITTVFSSADASSAMYDAVAAAKVSSSGNPGYVTLKSSYEDVIFNGMRIDRLSTPEAKVKEITNEGAIVELRYKAIEEAEDSISTYAVIEYFKLEYNNGQASIDIQDYQRKVYQDFNASGFDSSNNSINLGISAERDTDFLTDDESKKLAFVADNSLWFLDLKSKTYTSVYGTSLDEAEKERTPQEGYAIRLLSINEEVLNFVVYGRINEGVREGQTGIALYEYTMADSMLRELQFIKTDKSVDALKLSVGRFCYYDKEKRLFYTLLGDKLLNINIYSGDVTEMMDGMYYTKMLVSKDMKRIAFPNNSDLTQVTGITLIDFEKGTNVDISKDGKRMALLGFVGNDLMYGVADPEYVSHSVDGTPLFKFDELFIVHTNGVVVKDYKRENVLISGIEFQDNNIYLTRLMKSEETGGLEEIDGDYISYKPVSSSGDAQISIIKNELGNQETHIKFPDTVYVNSSNEELLTKVISGDDGNDLDIEDIVIDPTAAYIYDSTGLMGISYSVGKAVQQVHDNGGFVVNASGRMLYSEKTSRPYLTVAGTFDYKSVESEADTFAACNYMCILASGLYADYEEVKAAASWSESFKLYSDEVMGINLTGVSLDTAIGYLSDGCPFAAKLEDKYVLVVSYNSDFIRYYNPVSGEEERVNRNTFQRKCQDAGNEFYTYVK